MSDQITGSQGAWDRIKELETKVERLTEALQASAPLVCPRDHHTLGCLCICPICTDRRLKNAAACRLHAPLTEPGGQP